MSSFLVNLLEKNALEVHRMVPDHSHRAEDLRRAVASVLPALMRLVPLGVVTLQPEVVLG